MISMIASVLIIYNNFHESCNHSKVNSLNYKGTLLTTHTPPCNLDNEASKVMDRCDHPLVRGRSLHARIHYNAEPQPAHVVLSNILPHSLTQPVVTAQNKSISPRSVHHCTTQISTTYMYSNKMYHGAF